MAVNAQDILLVKAGMDAISDLLLKDGRSARHSKRKAMIGELREEVDYVTGAKQPPRDIAAPRPVAASANRAPAPPTGSSSLSASSRTVSRKPGAVVTSLAHEKYGGKDFIYCSCVDNSLWKYDVGDKTWNPIGAAQKVMAMAYFEGILYALDKQGSIWQMQLHGKNPTWLPFKAYTEGKMVSMTALDGFLYAATKTNRLVRKKIGDATGVIYNLASDSDPWRVIGDCLDCTGLTSWGGTLFAGCANMSMWQMNPNVMPGALPPAWRDAGKADFPLKQGFVAFNDRLHAANPEKLWARPLDPTARWQEWANLPPLANTMVSDGAGQKRKAEELNELSFDGDVKALKQWRRDLVENIQKTKADYQAALAELEAWRTELATQSVKK